MHACMAFSLLSLADSAKKEHAFCHAWIHGRLTARRVRFSMKDNDLYLEEYYLL